MPHSGGEVVDVDFGGGSAKRPVGRPPTLSSSRPSLSGGRGSTRVGESAGNRFAARPGSAATKRGSPSRSTAGTAPSIGAKKDFSIGQRIKIKRPPGQAGYADGIVRNKSTDGTYEVEYGEIMTC